MSAHVIIYAVLWQDRHTDTTVHLFTERESAIEWAKIQADDMNRHGYQSDWTPPQNDPSWVAYFPYSPEGDCLRVMELRVDEEVE